MDCQLVYKIGHNLAEDISKYISFNKNCCILIQILLKFVAESPIDNKSALVQIMAWHWTGAKPLSEPYDGLAYWYTYEVEAKSKSHSYHTLQPYSLAQGQTNDCSRGQSYDCLNTREVTLVDVGKIGLCKSTMK